jgi:hypothetical protein
MSEQIVTAVNFYLKIREVPLTLNLVSPGFPSHQDPMPTLGNIKRKKKQTNTNRTQSAMDLTQDSDNENFKVTKKRKKRARKDSEFGLDEIELYFHEPFYEEGEVSTNCL